MAVRLVGVDSDNPTLPAVVLNTYLHDSYAGKADGASLTVDTGQTWFSTGGAPLVVISGKLGNTSAGPAGYLDAPMGARVSRLGARFTFTTTGTTDEGAAALVVWATSTATAPFPPDSPCHIVFTPTYAEYGVWQAQVFTVLYRHVYAERLVCDDTTVHEAEIVLEGTTATVRFPAKGLDGKLIREIPNPLIGSLGGDFFGVEVYHATASTDHRPRFVDVWADAKPAKSYTTAPLGATLRAIGDNPRSALYLPLTAGNNVTTPDAAAHDITGDLCCVAHVAADDWSPADIRVIAGKVQASGQFSWVFYLSALGELLLGISTNGTAITYRISTVNLSTLPNGSSKWVAFTFDQSSGGNTDTRFWTSVDGITWTQLGATVIQGGSVATFSGTSHVMVGDWVNGFGNVFQGKIHEVSIRSGIGTGGIVGGTEVARYDASIPAPRYRDRYGNVWTVNGSAFTWMTA